MYINGFLDNSTGSGQSSKASSGLLTIDTRTGSSNYTDAIYEDFRIYDRVLSDSEIQTIYSCKGKDCIFLDLLHRWLMIEGSPGVSISGASIVKDHVGELNCTPYNSPVWDENNN